MHTRMHTITTTTVVDWEKTKQVRGGRKCASGKSSYGGQFCWLVSVFCHDSAVLLQRAAGTEEAVGDTGLPIGEVDSSHVNEQGHQQNILHWGSRHFLHKRQQC